jgi:type I restriction enzyme S subunit
MEAITENKVVPQLRFREFEEDWRKVRLKDVSKYFNGGSFEGDVKEEGKFELITLKSIDIDGNLVNSKRYIDKDVCTLIKGTLIMILSEQAPGLLGMTSIIPINNKYVLNQRVAEIRPNQKVESQFLSLAININQRYFSKKGAGTKVQNITKPNVENFEFLTPTLPEQQKIATFLSSVDAKLQQLSKKKSLLADYKKGVMQKIFSQELRFKPALSEVEGDANGNNYPEWEEKKLGEVFNALKGKGLSKDKLDDNGQLKCILYGELYTTYNEQITVVKKRTNSDEGVSSRFGDLLVPCSTTTTGIDLANVTALNEENVKLGGDISILRGKKEINNVFYAYYLSNYKKLDIARYGQGTTIVHLYFNHFKAMRIDIPPLEEQQKIANFLTALDAKTEKVNTQIKNTQAFKKGLLQQMFV